MIIKFALPIFLFAIASHGMEQKINHEVTITDQASVNKIVLEEFEKIVSGYHEKLTLINNTNDPALLFNYLKTGYWYPVDYFQLLNREELKSNSKVKERLEWMKERGSFTFGFSTSPSLKNVGKVHSDELFKYMLASNASASDVVTTFGQDSVILIDCAIAYQLAFYRAALRMFGATQFDSIFSQPSSKPLFAARTSLTQIHKFISWLDAKHFPNGIAGAVGHIGGHPFYQYKNLYGEGRGFNVMVQRKNKKRQPIFLGLGLNPEGGTKAFVKQALVDLFNAKSLDEELVDEKIWKSRPTASSALNTFLLHFLSDVNIAHVNDQSMMEGLSSALVSSFGESLNLNSAIAQLLQKFPTSEPQVVYFILDFELLKKETL